MPDLVIRNARLVLPEGTFRAELAVTDEKIEKIAISGIPKGDLEIDAKNRIVMPGAIDTHAHVHDPRFLHRETFRTGSAAAAAGGVTTIFVMPLDTPITDPQKVKKIISAGRRASIIDFALHAGNMTEEAIENVEALASLGVRSFKAFTCFPYYLAAPAMERLMEKIRTVNGVLFVHAEHENVLREYRSKMGNRKDPLAHHESRPSEAEERAVKEVLELVEKHRCRTHFAHITTQKACNLLRTAKQKHLPVTAETCVHYLVFTKEDVAEKGPYLRINPSLKEPTDRDALWESLKLQVIDTISTDHAPGTKKEKEIGWKDIWVAQIGIPGVETMMPLLLTYGVGQGRITLDQLVNAVSTRPAQIFGLYPRKGVLREGSDADLVILNFKKKKIWASKLHYKVGWTPYEGMTVTGYPYLTISRGEIVYQDGEILGRPGRGQYLPAG